jgi:uncharacterized protein (TIGR03437 family)
MPKKIVIATLMLSSAALAQQYVISTYAGGAPLPTPAPATSVNLDSLTTVATDTAGNVYFSSQFSLLKLDASGTLTRIAGNSRQGYSGDGGPALNAQIFAASGIATDAGGNLYFADSGRVRKITADGIVVTAAGNGSGVFGGDGGAATSAGFTADGVAEDASGNIFIADVAGGRIRKVTPDGIITTVAGNGTCCFSGDGGPATGAAIPDPTAVALDSQGDLFIASIANYQRIRKVSPDGTITTIAGGGNDTIANGIPGTDASLAYPLGLAVDTVGNVFIADLTRVRKVSPSGIITTVAGNGMYGSAGDGGPATAAQFDRATGVAVDSGGNLFIADNFVIRKVSTDGIITTVAGNGSCCFSGDGGPATQAQFTLPWDVALDATGNLFVADPATHRIRKISPDGIITTAVGNGASCSYPNGCPQPGDGGPATAAELFNPAGVAVDKSGNLLIADFFDSVRKVNPAGIITTVASGVPGFRVTSDAAGDALVMQGATIAKIAPDGSVSYVAGNGRPGFSGDGGPAGASEFDTDDPAGCDGPGGGMAFDPSGDLVFADTYNDRIRQITPGGIISTITSGSPLAYPSSLAFDSAGNAFITDFEANGVFQRTADGSVVTVAGNQGLGYTGDGGPAVGASLQAPAGIAVDPAGNIYVADTYNRAIRVLRPTNHSVLIGAVVDAASQSVAAVSPGKIVVIYGAGLGPAQLVQNQASGGKFGTAAGGTSVYFNGIAAPILYASSTQVAAVVPYAINGTAAQVTVAYQGETSDPFPVSVASSAPGIFTANQTGAGQAAAVNFDGTINSPTNPANVGAYVSLYATGEGQTSPAGVDGQVSLGQTHPVLPVTATVGGLPAVVQYAGGAPGQVAGLMQVNVQIPSAVQAGGYVPVVLKVGGSSTTAGAVWIAVAGSGR